MLRRFLNWLQGTAQKESAAKPEKSSSAETKRTPRNPAQPEKSNSNSTKVETKRTSRSYGSNDCYGSGVTWVNMSTFRNKDSEDKKQP